MTRRGTLAYYLAAWVIGCFIVSVPLAFADAASWQSLNAASLFTIYFFALIFGAADVLLFAFLLRRVMGWVSARSVWMWLFAGLVLAPALILLLARAGDAMAPLRAVTPVDYLLGLFWVAPNELRQGGMWWQSPIDGAAAAAVLFLVNRAFNRPAESETARAGQSPA
jgi:hypothetical protein